MSQQASNPPSLIDAQVVKQRLGGISDSTLWRLMRSGEIPAPRKIGARNFWRESEISAFVEGGVQK